MQLFARANEALYSDLASYAAVIRATIDELPKARALCHQVLAEVRLVQALVAFGSGNEAAELSRVALQLSNLWAIREETPARASGFSNEITESSNAVDQARRGQLIAARCGEPALASELEICFTNIIINLKKQQQLLEACHERLVPFRGSLDLTRKRLNLLMAAAEARLPDSPDRRHAVATYSTAASLLSEWSTGLPLDERALGVLDRCLELLGAAPDFDSHQPSEPVLLPSRPAAAD